MYIACVSLHVMLCHMPWSCKLSYNFASCYGLTQPVLSLVLLKVTILASPFLLCSTSPVYIVKHPFSLLCIKLHHTPSSHKFCHNFILTFHCITSPVVSLVMCWLSSAWKPLVKLGFWWPQPSKIEAWAMLLGLGQLRLGFGFSCSLWEYYHVIMLSHLFSSPHPVVKWFPVSHHHNYHHCGLEIQMCLKS